MARQRRDMVVAMAEGGAKGKGRLQGDKEGRGIGWKPEVFGCSTTIYTRLRAFLL
jgi:hypothetical protein